MSKTTTLVTAIKKGMEEKKGHRIVVADLAGIDGASCDCFVICHGNSPAQVEALVESVKDEVRIALAEKPLAVDGLRNATWVAMDYGEVWVHIFQPEAREFYNLEHLWADAALTEIPEEA